MSKTERKLYIKQIKISAFKVSVSGKKENGSLLFGFRLTGKDTLTWKEKARAYTPRGYLPVFES